jgi:hypothetical protein
MPCPSHSSWPDHPNNVWGVQLDLTTRILRLIERKLQRRWRKLNNGELQASHSSVDIIRMLKSRRIGWAGFVVRSGTWEICKQFKLNAWSESHSIIVMILELNTGIAWSSMYPLNHRAGEVADQARRCELYIFGFHGSLDWSFNDAFSLI